MKKIEDQEEEEYILVSLELVHPARHVSTDNGKHVQLGGCVERNDLEIGIVHRR